MESKYFASKSVGVGSFQLIFVKYEMKIKQFIAADMPVIFCTQTKLPWVEFAEDPYDGQTTKMLCEVNPSLHTKEKKLSEYNCNTIFNSWPNSTTW